MKSPWPSIYMLKKSLRKASAIEIIIVRPASVGQRNEETNKSHKSPPFPPHPPAWMEILVGIVELQFSRFVSSLCPVLLSPKPRLQNASTCACSELRTANTQRPRTVIWSTLACTRQSASTGISAGLSLLTAMSKWKRCGSEGATSDCFGQSVRWF